MKNTSLPVKVGILMTLAVVIVSAAGYLTFRNLSSIVASIEVKSRPYLRLSNIRDIAADIDKAESSVRMYRLTHNQQDIKPYYDVVAGVDDKVDSLREASREDTALLAQIDTISNLIEEKILVWNEMIDLYHTDSLEIYLRSLTAKIAVGTLNPKNSEKSILKRVFSRKALQAEARQKEIEARRELISDLNRIEKKDSIKNSLMMATEAKLAATGNEIRERFYSLITRMENEVIASIKSNSEAADRLAVKTYEWMALFAFLATLLIISVVFVVVRYVRKTKEYQEALEASKEETEKLSKTKELFMANMSHEIRTPVNAIYGFAEQMVHEKLNEKSRKMLSIIRSTSEHLVQVVNDILDFSKLENSKIELEKSQFELQPVFEDIKLLFEKNASGNNSRFYYSIGSAVPAYLFGDSHRLKQILFNLVGNAVKFTKNGEICLTASALNRSGTAFNLVIKIEDTGIGIHKDLQSKVFEDFTQAEAGTSRKYGGTGLGLSIVKKLVELHKGEIKLESEEGKGTSITCILPYTIGTQKNSVVLPETAFIPEKIKNLKILIVDDEEYNRLLFKTIFARWNVNYEEADSGQKAVEMIGSSYYDLVFMDARMPGMDGLEAAGSIRNKLGINSEVLPIIGTSATHSIEDMQMYLAAGMNAFLPKPFTEKMLLDSIQSVALNGEPQNQEVPDSPSGNYHLKNIYHLANNDITFVKQLLISFIDSTEQGLNGLQDAINSKDIHIVHEMAHKISSPCRHIGADFLYSRLKLIEEQSKIDNNILMLEKLSQESFREFLEIKKSLQKHIEKI